jgi:beta-glucosidase
MISPCPHKRAGLLSCYAFVGYIVGLWAPGKVLRCELAGAVLGNLLRAHVAAYRAIKALPGGQRAAIGLVHQHIKFFPRHNLPHVR